MPGRTGSKRKPGASTLVPVSDELREHITEALEERGLSRPPFALAGYDLSSDAVRRVLRAEAAKLQP